MDVNGLRELEETANRTYVDLYGRLAATERGSRRTKASKSIRQSARWEALTRGLDLRGKTCVILGVGYGAGVRFLEARGCEIIWGFDLINQFVQECKQEWPEHTFTKALGTFDAFEQMRSGGPIDWVFCNGALNVKNAMPHMDRLICLAHTMHAQTVRCGMAVTLTTNLPANDDCNSFSITDAVTLFGHRFRWMDLAKTYLDHDFCIRGWK